MNASEARKLSELRKEKQDPSYAKALDSTLTEIQKCAGLGLTEHSASVDSELVPWMMYTLKLMGYSMAVNCTCSLDGIASYSPIRIRW